MFVENISEFKREYDFGEMEWITYIKLLLYASGYRKIINTFI